ncbi:MAG: formylmethanofuran--tetrahydromethanopterin N-formyltransferase [Alphaproteobacteria bacterium]
MIVNGVAIDDTFAEAFGMKATRLVITADTPEWAMHAATAMTGFATSVIACGCEAGIEQVLPPDQTPDSRPGISVLLFSMSGRELAKQVLTRAGQCIMTSPTSALFSGIAGEDKIKLGAALRYFGDGFQTSKKFGGKRYWRIPVMDGEFLCEDNAYVTTKAVGGGNILILARSRKSALAAAECGVAAMRKIAGVIMPFPGGVVRSGSKVGSKYKALVASSNDAFCPTLKGVTATKLTPDVEAVLEIVIDGLTSDAISAAMRAGMVAICEMGQALGVTAITAGNYGGKLGPFHFHLRKILS